MSFLGCTKSEAILQMTNLLLFLSNLTRPKTLKSAFDFEYTKAYTLLENNYPPTIFQDTFVKSLIKEGKNKNANIFSNKIKDSRGAKNNLLYWNTDNKHNFSDHSKQYAYDLINDIFDLPEEDRNIGISFVDFGLNLYALSQWNNQTYEWLFGLNGAAKLDEIYALTINKNNTLAAGDINKVRRFDVIDSRNCSDFYLESFISSLGSNESNLDAFLLDTSKKVAKKAYEFLKGSSGNNRTKLGFYYLTNNMLNKVQNNSKMLLSCFSDFTLSQNYLEKKEVKEHTFIKQDLSIVNKANFHTISEKLRVGKKAFVDKFLDDTGMYVLSTLLSMNQKHFKKVFDKVYGKTESTSQKTATKVDEKSYYNEFNLSMLEEVVTALQ
jgi:hypothetical protein